MPDQIITVGDTSSPLDRRRLRDMGGGVYAPEVAATPPVPAAADIRSGSGAAGVTILTVPAGRVWRGTVTLAASASAAIGAAAASTGARIDLAGTGASPAAGTVLRVPLALPATLSTGTSGVSESGSASIPLVIVAGGVDATLAVVAETTDVVASGSVAGALL